MFALCFSVILFEKLLDVYNFAYATGSVYFVDVDGSSLWYSCFLCAVLTNVVIRVSTVAVLLSSYQLTTGSSIVNSFQHMVGFSVFMFRDSKQANAFSGVLKASTCC
jgi:hypothetical protein